MSGYTAGKIGTLLCIQDKNGEWLRCGDTVRYGKENRSDHIGIILYDGEDYNFYYRYSMWFGDNKYDPNSYGKIRPIPMDNGARMELELIERGT